MNYVKKMSLMAVSLGILATAQLTASSHGQKCGTYVKNIIKNNCAYQTIYNVLSPAVVSAISSLLYDVQVSGASAYAALYNYAVTLAASLSTGNIIITDPNGNVAVDTSKSAATNTYANYQAGTISPNQMENISFIDAQMWPCGLGVQTVYNNAIPGIENIVTVRLDAIPFSNVGSYSYLNSIGMVSMSVNAGAICS